MYVASFKQMERFCSIVKISSLYLMKNIIFLKLLGNFLLPHNEWHTTSRTHIINGTRYNADDWTAQYLESGR